MSELLRGLVCSLLLALSPVSRADEDSDLEEPISLSFWDKTVNLRGALGYKDNVLLSKAEKEGSAFWQSAFDFTLLRASLDQSPTITFFVSGEDRRYFSSRSVDKEQLLLSQMKATKPFAGDWTAGIVGQYLYA